MTNRRIVLTLILLAAIGCDGKDPERLGRVGKKIVEKSRQLADDADLPRVTISKPRTEERGEVGEIPPKK